MGILRLAVPFTAVALCVGTTGAQARQPEAAPHHQATRVLVGPCLFRAGSGESPIGTALLGSAIEQGLNLVGSALRSAGEGGTVTFSGTGNFDLARVELARSCVLVIQGRFITDFQLQQAPDTAWAGSMGLTSQMLGTLRSRHNVILADAPDFMFEAVLRHSRDGKAFTLRPLYAAMNRPFERPLIDPQGGRRSVAIMLSFVPPGAVLDAADNPGTELNLGELRRGRYVRYRIGRQAARPPQNGGNAGTAVQSQPYIPWPLESRWFQLDEDTITGPITARVVVTQTRSPSALFKFLSSAFTAAQDEIQTAATTALDPARRRTAQIEELAAEEALRSANSAALRAALTSLNACATTTATSNSFAHQSTRLTLADDVRAKQDAANRAARAARVSVPFERPQLVEVTPDPSVKARCVSVRNYLLTRMGGSASAEEEEDTTPPPEEGGVPPPQEEDPDTIPEDEQPEGS